MTIIAIAWQVEKGAIPVIGLGSKERVTEATEAVRLASGGLMAQEE